MTQKEIQTTVYEASDGKQFISKDDCKRYEEHLREIADIQYFVVWAEPELTETGRFTKKIAVAVNKHRYLAAETIINAWAIERFGYIGVSVQGYGLQRYYSVSKTPKDNYFNPEYNERGKERIFISTKDVDGFPPKTDMMSTWLKKYEHK